MTINLNAADVFSKAELARVCTMHETKFGAAFGMERFEVEQRAPENYYFYKDNGSDVLAVAHLDTVGAHNERAARFVQTEAGLVVYSRALDDRLGAYIITDMLPKLGIECDWLFTVGEESGCSTAEFFEAPKLYDWMIEFDRGVGPHGNDVVMYQYDDIDTRQLVRDCGARVGDGIFSDISYLEHLGIKGFNWGVGYRDYHGPKAHAYLDDTFDMVDYFQVFHEQNVGRYMHHEEQEKLSYFGSRFASAYNYNPDSGEPDADEYPGLTDGAWKSGYRSFRDEAEDIDPDLDNPNSPFYVSRVIG